jgi:hypothetical protein
LFWTRLIDSVTGRKRVRIDVYRASPIVDSTDGKFAVAVSFGLQMPRGGSRVDMDALHPRGGIIADKTDNPRGGIGNVKIYFGVPIGLHPR